MYSIVWVWYTTVRTEVTYKYYSNIFNTDNLTNGPSIDEILLLLRDLNGKKFDLRFTPPLAVDIVYNGVSYYTRRFYHPAGNYKNIISITKEPNLLKQTH